MSSITKRFSWNLRWNPTTSKRVTPLRTSYTKIVSSHDVVFDKLFSSALAYTSHPYSEAIAMQPEVSYIMYIPSSHEQTGDIITFPHFEDVCLLEN